MSYFGVSLEHAQVDTPSSKPNGCPFSRALVAAAVQLRGSLGRRPRGPSEFGAKGPGRRSEEKQPGSKTLELWGWEALY